MPILLDIDRRCFCECIEAFFGVDSAVETPDSLITPFFFSSSGEVCAMGMNVMLLLLFCLFLGSVFGRVGLYGRTVGSEAFFKFYCRSAAAALRRKLGLQACGGLCFVAKATANNLRRETLENFEFRIEQVLGMSKD
jgi:hypothetical protein